MSAETFVALDIETTGLDVESDRVTEIGAVRFRLDGEEIEVFEALVNPGRPIPPFVTQLTGLSDDDVRGAPSLPAFADSLKAFVGDSLVVGQNIGFDLAHLRRGGIAFERNVAIDTVEFSRLLLPGRVGGLEQLAETLEITVETSHRALADARTAARVFTRLAQRAHALDHGLRLQLARLIALHNLPLAEIVAGNDLAAAPVGERALPSIRPAPEIPALARREPPVPTPAEQVQAVFRAGETALPEFDPRVEQLEMADHVRHVMSRGGHLLVEAGTGVGKSLAYLVPASLHALANGERIVISTNTINLQDQLFSKDIPALRRMLRAAGVIASEHDLRVSLLKGRANYLCLRRFTASYAANLGDPDFARLAASMLLWLPDTATGDRAELSLSQGDWVTWQRFSAQDADCLQRPNAVVRDGNCFLQRARKGAEGAHLIIVNHALLLADVAAGGGVLPAFDHLVVDEAHNLEEQATKQFGATVTRRFLVEALDAVYRPRSGGTREGGVVTILKALPEGAASMAGMALEQATIEAVTRLGPCFTALAEFLPGQGEDDRTLVDRGLRAQPGWSEPEIRWSELDRALSDVGRKAALAANVIREGTPVEEPDAIAGEIESAARKVEELRLVLEQLMTTSDPATVTWLGRERDGTASLNSAPLDVGPTLWEELFSKKRTVVATSATLAASGSMDFTARRIGLETPETAQIGSPFDYEHSTLLCAATDLPDPSAPGYDELVGAAIATLVRASNGRALALFTSHGSLQRAAARAKADLEGTGIAVLVQGADGSPRQLQDNLKASPRSVIFGTASFWEGVDIRGTALSLLVIARLPFSVPTDPVYRARSEQYDEPFREFALPNAILKFRQGFGRLIRDRRDRGVVAVLDRRLYEKRYGVDFIDALPRCTRLKDDTDAIARWTAKWLA